MAIKLDAIKKVEFPDLQVWGEFFVKWNQSIIDSLGAKYNEMDRQDAVINAFLKLMYKKRPENYNHIPETEAEWYGCVKWQARASLKHAMDSGKTRLDYHRKAFDQMLVEGTRNCVCNLDKRECDHLVFATLYELCEEAHMKKTNVDAYVEWYLKGGDSRTVARAFGANANNLYAIRFRVEKLLAQKGRRKYLELQRKNFLQAA